MWRLLCHEAWAPPCNDCICRTIVMWGQKGKSQCFLMPSDGFHTMYLLWPWLECVFSAAPIRAYTINGPTCLMVKSGMNN